METNLSERARCDDQFVERYQWNHDHRRACDAPAKNVCPRWIDVVLVAERFVPDQTVDDDEQQEKRGHEFPADAPVDARSETDHVFDVLAEALRSWIRKIRTY